MPTPAQAGDVIDRLRIEMNITNTEVLRRALSLYELLHDAQAAGAEVWIVDVEGREKLVKFK